MTLSVGATITGGIDRVTNRNGLVLIVAAALIGLSWQITVNSFFAQLLPPDLAGSLGATVDVPLPLLGIVGAVSFFLLSYVSIVSIRTFVAGETSRIPRDLLRRRIGWAVANLLVGGLVYSLLTFVGTLLLVVPGIIAYVAFLFMSMYVAVDDENFVAAMVDSWHLTRGSWIRLFLLLLIVIVPVMIVFTVVSMGVSLASGGSSAATQVVSGLLSMPFSIVILGILSEAFVRLRGTTTSTPDGPAGADSTGEPTVR